MSLLHPLSVAAALLLGAVAMVIGMKLTLPAEKWREMDSARRYGLLVYVFALACGYVAVSHIMDTSGIGLAAMKWTGVALWLLASAMILYGLGMIGIVSLSRYVTDRSRRRRQLRERVP